jgi:hypothetical protein
MRNDRPHGRYRATCRRHCGAGDRDRSLNQAIQEIWAAIKSDVTAQEMALAAGLERGALVSINPPFVADREQSAFGRSAAIVVFMGLDVSRALGGKTVEEGWDSKVWEEYFWPRVLAKFGLEPPK